MKGFFVIILVASLFVFGLMFLIHSADVDEATRYVEWRNFVMQHHCKVKESHNWSGATIWACDGFELEHQ